MTQLVELAVSVAVLILLVLAFTAGVTVAYLAATS